MVSQNMTYEYMLLWRPLHNVSIVQYKATKFIQENRTFNIESPETRLNDLVSNEVI